MTAARRALALAVAAGLLTSCGLRSASAASSQRPTMTIVPTTTATRTASKPAAPSLADARVDGSVTALGGAGKGGSVQVSGAAVNVARLYQRLADDIRNDTRESDDFEVAVRLTELLDAIDQSADQGRAIAPAHGAKTN